MKFLVPLGGIIDEEFGVLTTYKTGVALSSIAMGFSWAGDNCAFHGFDEEKFFAWLPKMEPYRKTCLFIAVPDVVGNAAATLEQYAEYAPRLAGWPLAYVAQDGSEILPIPAGCTTLFVGGTTEWKTSDRAVSVIRRAQKMNLHIHIGRVNWKKRYDFFRVLSGSDDFTCDGTRTRFQGKERTLRAWKGYMSQFPLLHVQEELSTQD